MPSSRRIRTTVVLAITAVLVLFYITTGPSSTRSSEFYSRTVASLDALKKDNPSLVKSDRKAHADIGRSSHDDIAEPAAGVAAEGKPRQKPFGSPPNQAAPLKDAISGVDLDDKNDLAPGSSGSGSGPAAAAKKLKEIKYGARKGDKKVNIPSDADADVAGAAARQDGVAKVGNKGKEARPQQAVLNGAGADADAGAGSPYHDPNQAEEHTVAEAVETELDGILKRSPIIIFSKSYCPYSTKAKRLLLNKYKIVPAPYVVELDIHPLGKELQNALLKITGQKTVPNILVNGKSMGGSDDLAALESKGKLREELLSLGGKRLMEVVLA